MPPEPIRHTLFEPCLNQPFKLAGLPVTLTLTEVRPLSEEPQPPAKRIAFSLLFAGPAAPVMPQQTYQLENDTLGERNVFLVPIGPNADGAMLYEAIFN